MSPVPGVATWQLCPTQATCYINRCHRGIFFSSETTYGCKSQKSNTEHSTRLLCHGRSPEAGKLNLISSAVQQYHEPRFFPFFLSAISSLRWLFSLPSWSQNVCHSSRHYMQTSSRTALLIAHLSEQENLSQNSPGSLLVTSH